MLAIQELLNTFNRDNDVTIKLLSEFFKKINKNIKLEKLDENLYIVHNSYKDVDDSDVYRETRCLVIEIKDNNALIVAKSYETPVNTRLSDFEFQDTDIIQEMYEGTTITAFYHRTKWYYITRSRNMDTSFYSNGRLTFGKLFNDCLSAQSMTRRDLEEKLDIAKEYQFIIVHHLNVYTTNYENEFKNKHYKKLFFSHINDSDVYPDVCIPLRKLTREDVGLKPVLVLRWDERRGTFKYFKVINRHYDELCTKRQRYPNMWKGMMDIYCNNDEEYTVEEYVNDFEMDEININNKEIHLIKFFTTIYRETSYVISELISDFTEYNDDGTYTKKNSEQFNNIRKIEHSNKLLQMITFFQSYYSKNLDADTFPILKSLKFTKTVNEMISILNTIVQISEQYPTMLTISNSDYLTYVKYLLNKVNTNI